MPRSLSSIREALESALARLSIADELTHYPIWSEWDAIVGEAIARHARPRRLRGGVLVVAVDGPDWMHELRFLKDDLLAKLNGRLGRPVVRDVYLVLEGEP